MTKYKYVITDKGQILTQGIVCATCKDLALEYAKDYAEIAFLGNYEVEII